MDPQNPEAILQRLEELRRWQEEQQTALHAKQIAQRDLLNMEQQKLYELFGLSMSCDGSAVAADETPASDISCDESRQQLMRNLCEMTEPGEQQQQRPGSSASAVVYEEPILSSADHEKSAKESDMYNTSAAPTGAKRAFLRRGEGLQSRFGLHPDALRINNLPKYKYAGAHRQSRFFRNATQKLVVKPLPSHQRVPWIGASDDDDLGAGAAATKNTTTKPPSAIQPPPERIDAQRPTAAIAQPSQSMRPRSNFSVQETPIRDKIRQQQAEIDELVDFEQLENNLLHTLIVDGRKPPAAVPDSPPLQPLSTDSDDDDDRHAQPRATVRFHSQVLVNQAPQFGTASDTETYTSGTDMDVTETTVTEKTSTPNVNDFRAFKAKLFRAHQRLDESTITDADDEECHVVDSVPMGQPINQQQTPAAQASTDVPPPSTGTRLELTHAQQQLEQEIALFRQQNARLTAAAQQLQLDRVALTEERCAHEERCADERARAEIQLHDERIKLVAEREALERRARELRGPNRREREETAALRERVEQLEREAAAKDQRHVAAQARLRAQLRTMEKDLKEYTFEMEQLRKEGKKLEAENARLRRESNSKMLTEINRNIARLGEKVVAGGPGGDKQQQQKPPTTGGGAKVKPVPKVVTHAAARTRTRSVPNLTVLQPDRSCTSSSSSDDDEDTAEAEQTHYFKPDKSTRLRARSQDKENTETQTEDPPSAAPAANSKREIVNADGSKDILYPNGNLKKVSADSMRVRMLYFNKDIKETNVGEGTVKYYYAETNTWQTSYLDGLEILEFPNGQIEHRHRDGKIEVHFPNGSVRLSDPANGAVLEEWRYADGTRVEQRRNGERVLSLANGQREVHTAQHRRREYPDGTVKLVYPDGSQETRYSNGRVRLKDRAGKLVMDSENLFATTTNGTSTTIIEQQKQR